MVLTHLDQSVLFNVILESSQLQVQDGREIVENDTLLRRLQAVTFGVVFVLSFEGFHRDVISERVAEVSYPLDGELDV